MTRKSFLALLSGIAAWFAVKPKSLPPAAKVSDIVSGYTMTTEMPGEWGISSCCDLIADTLTVRGYRDGAMVFDVTKQFTPETTRMQRARTIRDLEEDALSWIKSADTAFGTVSLTPHPLYQA